MNEEWRDVLRYELILQVSSLGRVRSKERIVHFSDDKPPRLMGGKILKTQVDDCGYLRLRFNFGKMKVTKKVHRLVAEAFIPNLEDKPQVNHKDGVKTNNLVTNLEWSTNGENQTHAIELGLKVTKVGAESCRFIAPIKVFNSDGDHIETLIGNKDMEEKGYDFRLVSACLHGKRNTHKGCTFVREIPE